MAPVLLGALVLAALAATTASLTLNNQLPGCQARCGQVEIPYPFGIGDSFSTSGANCSRPGFEIGCVGGGLTLWKTQIQVLELSTTPRPEARVMLPVAYQCYNSSGDPYGNFSLGTVEVNPAGVYRISNSSNELFVLGCNTLVYTTSAKSGNGLYSHTYYTGCVAYCNDSRSAQDGACAGVGCCHVDIPPGLTDNFMEFGDSWSHASMEFSPCDYAFIVEKDHYQFRADDLTSMPLNRTMPLRLHPHAHALRRRALQSRLRLRQRPQRVRQLQQWPWIRLQLHPRLPGQPLCPRRMHQYR